MSPLETLIRDHIVRHGPLTFRDFMALALYDPEQGYYTSANNRIGRAGDFYTASSISSHFGKLLARQVEVIWRVIGQPADFTVVECGAGTGALAADILTALHTNAPDMVRHLHYVIDERSPAMQAVQATRLSAFSEEVRWQTLEELSKKPVTGLIFSNELVDALPVHLLAFHQGQYLEGLVSVSKGHLRLIWETPTRLQDFITYLTLGEIQLAEGEQCEVALDALDWLARAAAALARGYLITIDYGDIGRYLSGRPTGTIRCFTHHRVSADILANPGQQDITADVNFSALIHQGIREGLRCLQLMRQSDYLIRLGLLDLLEAATRPEQGREALQERLALKHFLVPSGFGNRFKVLVQTKGNGLPDGLPVPPSAFTGGLQAPAATDE
ncbi:MAG: class I SAM-dependent methyltransferase [Acidobacteriota bacterium]